MEHPDVEMGAQLLRESRWSDARRQLEVALQDPAVLFLPPAELTKVHCNPSVARRFDPSTMGDLQAHYVGVLNALQEAGRLDPTNGLYMDSVAAVQADQRRASILRQQHEAAAANYGRAGR